jgi:hypothetical protein
MRTISLLAALALSLGAEPLLAQTLTSVVPEAAEPGDLIVLRGTGLGSVTQVQFTGTVGGFVGIWNVVVAPTSVSPTEVRAIVPTFNNFVGPAAVPPSSPFGSVKVSSSNQLKFYFMEEKHGQVTTPGQGTTQSNGERAVIHFALSGGEPVSSNPTFAPRIGLAVPGAVPVLGVGQQAPMPFLPIGDGTLTLNLSSPLYAMIVGAPVDAAGNSGVALPIPQICPSPSGTFEDPVCGVPVALQWGMIDPVTQTLVVSTGMCGTL